MPVTQAFLVGVVFDAVLPIGYHVPRSHLASVDVVGGPTSVRVLFRDVNQREPGALNLVRVRSARTSLESLGERRIFGVLTLAAVQLSTLPAPTDP